MANEAINNVANQEQSISNDNIATKTAYAINTESPGDNDGQADEQSEKDSITLSQSELDRLIQQKIKTNEKNIRSKLEAELSKEKLTAEEQVAELRHELAIEKSRIQAEKRLMNLELEIEQTSQILDMIVSDDSELTVEKADFISELISSKINSAIQEHEKKSMSNAKKPNETSNRVVETQAEKMAKKISESMKGNKSRVTNILKEYT